MSIDAKKYLVRMQDGTVIITTMYRGLDIEKYAIDKWVKPTKADVLDWREVSDSEIPADRTYRAAWRWDGTKIVEDPREKRKIQAGMALFAEAQAARQKSIDDKVRELEGRA